jgi:aryl-alcohol dehydrogenase-like predicted oxidoreductase
MTGDLETLGALPTAELGRTGLRLSRVGFGAWALGGGGWKFGWGSQDVKDSVAAIHCAVGQGINWVDTAPVYGLGRSEEVVGEALRDLPPADRPYIFTKCGLVFDAARPEDGPSNVLAASSIRRELDASLRRLGVEHIDLYQVHWPPEDGTGLEEYWATMAALVAEGKVGAIGLSNHDLAGLQRAEAVAHVDSVQPPFSLIHRSAAQDLLPWCASNGTGAIVYSPMQSGLLSGAMTPERVAALPADDWRASHEDFTGQALSRNLALTEALRPVAQRHGVQVGAVAVAWTLAWPGVTGAIVGARTPSQVEGWITAATLELSDDDLADIGAAVVRTGAGEGPAAPRD